MAKVWIALGANLDSMFGGPERSLVKALEFLSNEGCEAARISSFYQTPCFPAGAGPDYINTVAEFDCHLLPHELLNVLHAIEHKMGRVRTERWAGRSMDLDLLAYEGEVLPEKYTVQKWIDLSIDAQMKLTPDDLLLPHPRMQDRAFVLVPFLEIAPSWRHPILQKTVAEMYHALPLDQRDAVIKLAR